MTQAANVIRFSIDGSRSSLEHSTRKRRRQTRGGATSSKPSLPLLALCEETIPASLSRVLRTLDAEQLQIVEIIASAIARGQL